MDNRTRRNRLILAGLLAVVLVLAVYAGVALTPALSQGERGGTVVEFDGRVLRLPEDATLKVESASTTTVYTDVTVTTSVVTVTVWR